MSSARIHVIDEYKYNIITKKFGRYFFEEESSVDITNEFMRRLYFSMYIAVLLYIRDTDSLVRLSFPFSPHGKTLFLKPNVLSFCANKIFLMRHPYSFDHSFKTLILNIHLRCTWRYTKVPLT